MTPEQEIRMRCMESAVQLWKDDSVLDFSKLKRWAEAMERWVRDGGDPVPNNSDSR